jgi:tetratricopeptide (TPR) repeat protein
LIGRKEDLKKLHQQLQTDQPVVISAIAGMGGIGKSELALQYAYQHLAPTYPGGICWLNARADVGLKIVEFARLYADLTPPPDWEIVEKVRWCWQQWRDGATLIVFDDVQDYDDVRSFLPPPKSQFRTLLTSRHKFPSPVQNYQIQVLSKTAAVQLLGSFHPEVRLRIDADLATAEAICHWLGYLPLGLELVGRYLANDLDLSLAEVWQALQSERLMAQALAAAEAGMTAELGVIAAFELSWQKLTPPAQSLAARLSLFALAEIPWSLVEQCLADWQPQALKDLRKALLDASLLTRTRQGMYELHQLLREFFALKLAEMPQREEFTTKFAQVLTEVAKTIPEIVTLEWQTNLIEFIPHLAAATEFSQYLDGVDKLWCCTGLGRFYESQSQFNTVESWYRKSLSISEEQLGVNHPDTAVSLSTLAGLRYEMGRYTEAEPLLVRSLAISEEQLGANHPRTAASLNNLAELYRSIGRYTEAELLLVRSLAISEEQLGTNHPRTATSLNNLAGLYKSIGRYAEAQSLFVRSLAISEDQLGINHPNTSTSLSDLAGLYYEMGRYTEAEPLLVRSLAISEEQLGANHPRTAASLNNLAELYRSIGRYSEAEPLFVRSLAISEEQLGTNHPDTSTSLNNLASLYESIGRYSEAKLLYVRSLAISEEQLGANHPYTATSLNNLAGLYELSGRSAEAEPLYERALEILEQSLGSNHPKTQTIRKNLQILRQPPATTVTPAASMTWVEWLVAIPLLPFYLAYEGLRRVGKIVAILAIIPIVPFWWGYRQLRFLWLKRRRKIRRQRRG